MLVAGSQKDTWLVKCDCCGEQTLAEITSDRIIIKDRRHGSKHTAIITIDDLKKSAIIN
jgi:hypothetical protein